MIKGSHSLFELQLFNGIALQLFNGIFSVYQLNLVEGQLFNLCWYRVTRAGCI